MTLAAAPAAANVSACSSSRKQKPVFSAGLYVARDQGSADNEGERSQSPPDTHTRSTLAVPTCISLEHSGSLSLDDEIDAEYDLHEEHQSEQNEQKGLCLSCGNKLFAIKTKKRGIFKQKTESVRVPLSIPGRVERGQCLQCTTLQQQTQNAGMFIEGRGGGDVSPSTTMSSEQLQQPSNMTHSSAMTDPNTSKAIYEGNFNAYGERDGKGTMTWENGDAYTGDFFNGNRHGHGTLQFSDGSEYVGEWECNQQHGVGTRCWLNGDCYTGQYSRGQRTGEGRFYFANGDLYVGGWQGNILHGLGRYYYSNGQRFEGSFVAGQRQGKGKLQRRDGSLDIGVYSSDKRCGVGVRWSADRTQTWRMLDGKLQKRITVPEAVALDYDIEAHADQIMRRLSPSADDAVLGVV